MNDDTTNYPPMRFSGMALALIGLWMWSIVLFANGNVPPYVAPISALLGYIGAIIQFRVFER